MIPANYLKTQDGVPVYVTAPAKENLSYPTIIVLQEAFGVNSHIRDVCHRLSREGYLCVAPELYHRQGWRIEIDYREKDLFSSFMKTLTNENLLDDLHSTMDFILDLPNTDENNVFALGFCMGGFTSILAATELPLRGAISYYGAGLVRPREGYKIHPFLESWKAIKCPLLFFMGQDDVSIPESDRKKIQELSSKLDSQMKVFPHANHGFFCDQRPSFESHAAREAWSLTLEWLRNMTSNSSLILAQDRSLSSPGALEKH